MSFKVSLVTQFCKFGAFCRTTHYPYPVNQLLHQMPFKLSAIYGLRSCSFSQRNVNTVILKHSECSRLCGALNTLFNNTPIHNYLRCLCTVTSNTEEDCQIIYKGSISKRVKRVKIVSITGSIMGLAALPKLLSPVLQSSLVSAVLLVSCSSFFIIATPLILHWMCRRYIMELKFDCKRKQFTATVMSLFLRKKHIVFSAHEVVVPGTPLLLTSFLVRGYPLLVDAEDFTDIDVYKHLMGYDKPIDFHMKNQE